jgi:nitrite reductase/ring-hydroxylating ferredoxin subunit
MKIEESYIARRGFLCGMIGGGAVALASGAAAPLGSYVGNLREEPPPPFLEIPEAEWHLGPGKAKLVLYGRIPALLIRTPEPQSEFRAFVATCTHFDCIVGYREEENYIFCACHGGYYDTDGNVTAGPPPRPLRPFHFAFRRGTLLLALEKENLDEALRTSDA